MNKDDKNTQAPEEEGVKDFKLLYVAIGCFAVSTVLLGLAVGLSFVISNIGIYLLISSMVLALAAVSFINGQKRKATNTLCKVIQILSYAVMIAGLALFIFGASVSGLQKQ